jgi:hypothetical protein
MQGDLADRNVRYTINRLAALAAADGKASESNFLVRSFAAFQARRREEEQEYLAKVKRLWNEALAVVEAQNDPSVLLLSSQSGLDPDHLNRLRQRLAASTGSLPVSVAGWVDWILDWLREDEAARNDLLLDVRRAVNRAVGRAATSTLNKAAIEALREPLKAWIEGKPLNQIEQKLGGDPSSTESNAYLPRAREMAGTIVPRGLSFIAGVVARLTEETGLPSKQPGLSPQLLQNLGACVRRGFDVVAKLEFANANRELIGRVQAHKAYDEAIRSIFEEFSDD